MSDPDANPEHALTAQQAVLSKHWDWSERERLAKSPGLLLETQLTLAQDKRDSVRAILAGNPCIHPRVQQILKADSETTLEALAENPSLVPSLQRSFLSSDVVLVRLLAENLGITQECQLELSAHVDGWVVLNLRLNPSLILDERMPLAFVYECDRKFVKKTLKASLSKDEREVAKSLRPTWQGTLTELVEAARLVVKEAL